MKKVNIFTAFLIMLPKVARVAPALFAIFLILSIAHGVAFGITAPVTQLFFDRATAFSAGEAGLAAVIWGLLILALSHVVQQALNGVANFLPEMYFIKTEGAQSLGLHKKLNKIAPIHFENTETLDEINKAIEGKNQAVWFVGTILSTLTFYVPYFAVMAIYLLSVKPLLVISLALIFIPTLATQLLRAKIFSKVEDKSAPVRREFGYYESCMVGREYFKETRVLGAFSYFRRLYADTLTLLNRLRFRASVKSDLAELAMQILSLGGYVGILFLLLDSLMKGEISVGAFAAIFASIGNMFNLMRELIVSHFGSVARNFGKVQNYIKFMQMPERAGADTELDGDADIALQNVSFSYPGADKKAVENLSVTIKSGETVAVVGENGSGKTTLVRLLTGLYLPDEGDILYGKANTKAVSMRSLFKNISAVFQKYQRYQMSLRDNIGVGDVDRIAEDGKLDQVGAQAGVDKNDSSFTNGYDTMLSREFDGVDLSGGQWQRIAIARSFFREHKLIVLDEPTAAIDPIEETKIYNRFAEISRDKTAIIVTHRLGSVKLADRILVMREGKLVEQGTHDELIQAHGEYARLYRSQEQWYTA
jgi:ATP-binding cassette subfamily B protein